MRLDNPLDDLFRTRSHVRVLRALHELPDGLSVSAREVARRAGVSHPTASEALASLAEQGVVTARRSLRADDFELNGRHLLADQVRRLFESERGLREELIAFLKEAIDAHTDAVEAAFVFGSAARGEMEPRSDIDVALVCHSGAAQDVSSAMREVGDAVRGRFGNELNVVLAAGPLEELTKSYRPGNKLWRRILDEGILVLGSRARA